MPPRRFTPAMLVAVIGICGVSVGPREARAQSIISESFLLRAWEVDEGLPVNAVQAIAQTADGYLWLATGSSLVRFDGLRFTSFNRANGLEGGRAHALCVRRSGELWIGLERGGVARWRQGKLETVVPVAAPDSTAGFVTSLADGGDGAVWMGFAGEKRVVRWMEGKLTTYGAAEGVGPGLETFVYADSGGRIWLATKSGSAFFEGDRFHPIEP